jgi:hypothetical protein
MAGRGEQPCAPRAVYDLVALLCSSSSYSLLSSALFYGILLDIDIPEEKTSTKTSNDAGAWIPVTRIPRR